MTPMYLKPNVAPEPLIGGWYAWSHLVSPATCAMNVVDRHLKIMSSYIQAPQIHAAAVRDPRMAGGPFVDYPSNRAADVRQLKEATITGQAGMIAFAAAVKELNALLHKDATGFSLDGLYANVPEVLKGYVELFYDAHHQPSFRFYEQLLYDSPYYDRRQQSLAFQLVDGDDRPFVLSTPRLSTEGTLHLQIPFEAVALDDLFRMQKAGGSYTAIRDALEISEADEPRFREFFTGSPPAAGDTRYCGGGVRLRYYGHACLLVETRNVSVLTDPMVSYKYPSQLPRYTFEDLPDTIDYVLITHNHQDHILLETLLQIRHRVRNVVVPRNGDGQIQDPSLKLLFRALGFANVIEIDEFDRIEIPGGMITGLPFMGEHSDLNIRTKMCHHVRLENQTFLFAADSSVHEPRLYEHIHRCVGDVTALFLGMECDGAPLSWLYGPLVEPIVRDKDRSRRLAGSDFERAVRMVDVFNPREVYVYAMGQEPWLNYIMSLKYEVDSNPIVHSNRLVNVCRERGIVAERLYGSKEVLYTRP